MDTEIKGDIKSLESDNEKLINMKMIPISSRENIGVENMGKYEFGGLAVESLEANGVLMYIPYGIYVDIFRAIERGIISIGKEIDSLEDTKNGLSGEYAGVLRENLMFQIKELEKQKNILEQIYPLIDEV